MDEGQELSHTVLDSSDSLSTSESAAEIATSTGVDASLASPGVSAQDIPFSEHDLRHDDTKSKEIQATAPDIDLASVSIEKVSEAAENVESQTKKADSNSDETGEPEKHSKADPESMSESGDSRHAPAKDTLAGDELKPFPPGYILSSALEPELDPSEFISCFACQGANLYIGTSSGKLLHFHFFEDASEYMLIMQLSANEARKAIQKIVLLPDAEVTLVLYNKTVSAYTFPELSPCHIGKIRDVRDFSVLSQGQKSKSGGAFLDKIIVYTHDRIRLVQISQTTVKLLKDINYSNAKMGVSTACNMQANYSKICVVANSQSYEVVDMQKPQKIPLFPYNPAAVPDVQPYILPFTVPGAASEEYLLPICTDEKNSMAMFTNSSGDATRGTLTWSNLGYPIGGLVIEWPYVLGLFGAEPYTQYVITSLESLEVVKHSRIQDIPAFSTSHGLRITNSVEGVRVFDEELSSLSAQVYYSNGDLCTAQKSFFHTGHAVFLDGKALHCMVKSSPVALKVRDLIANFHAIEKTDLNAYIKFFSEQDNSLCQDLHLVLLVVTEKFDRLKDFVNSTTDVRLILLFAAENLDDPKHPFWSTYTLPRVVRDLLIAWKAQRGTIVDREYKFSSQESRVFVIWLFQQVFNKESFDETVRQKCRYYAYVVGCSTSHQIIQKVHSEPEIWASQNEVNSALIRYFEEKHYYLALIEVYLIKQSYENAFSPWEVKIIDVCLGLLAGKLIITDLDEPSRENSKISIKFETSWKTYDLSALICDQLNKITDEKVYTKKLLDFVALEAEDGLRFLQKNSKGRFQASHKEILQQVSKSLKFDSNYPFLKVQYSEQLFQEMISVCETSENFDLQLAQELLVEYTVYLNRDNLSTEYENLDILFHAFQVENDLADPKWPKVTWLEFLSLNCHKMECSEFLEVWLKTNELLLLLFCKSAEETPDFAYSFPVLKYSQIAFSSDTDKIAYFLSIRDYTAAEHSALYSVPPLTRNPILLKPFVAKFGFSYPSLNESQSAKSLGFILSAYLENADKLCRNYSVMHLVEAHGNTVFGIDQIIMTLPEDFPLMFIENFLVEALIDLEEQKRQSSLTKALTKLDAKRSGNVVREFTQIVESLEKK